MKVYLLIGRQHDCEDTHVWVSSVWGNFEDAAFELHRLTKAFSVLEPYPDVATVLKRIADLRKRTPQIDPGAKTSDDWTLPEYEIQEHEVRGEVVK